MSTSFHLLCYVISVGLRISLHTIFLELSFFFRIFKSIQRQMLLYSSDGVLETILSTIGLST